jgi:ribose transport system substrate-binding protein
MRITAGLVVPLLLVSSACRPADEPGEAPLILPETRPAAPPAPAEEPRTVALVMKTLINPFFIEMEQGARRAERELGIRLAVLSAADEASVEQQISIVRQVIRDRVDAIVIVPGHSVEMVPVVAEARQAGIVVVNIDERLDPETSRKLGLTSAESDHRPDVPFVGVDNEHGAYLSARYLAGKLTGPTKAVILQGDPASRSARDRERGALRAFAESPHVEVVARETAHWKIDEAYDVTARLFEKHPGIGAIFCANDLMALGAIRYLEQTGKKHVLVAAYDAIEPARAALRRGNLVATVNQRAGEQGYIGVRHAVRALAGETLPAETFVDVELVTAESLAPQARRDAQPDARPGAQPDARPEAQPAAPREVP